MNVSIINSIIFAASACALGASFQAHAKIKDIVPFADSGISSGNPDTNYGDSISLYVQSADSSFANQRTWMQFDLAGQIPAGATISAVKLRMYNWNADDQGDAMTLDVHGSNNDGWTETGITWNTQPAFDATVMGSTALQGPNEFRWVEVDVTDFVKAEYAGDKVVSLVLKPNTESESQWQTYVFNSREYNTNTTPRLRIEFSGDWPTQDSVNIIHMNDIHSRLTTHDLDFPDADGEAPGFEKAGGVAHLTTKVLELKGNTPQSLILDAGDISEGNPLGDLRGNGGTIDFFEALDSQLKALGSNNSGRGVDAIVVGNHDVRAISMVNNMKNSPMPFISVNILDDGAPIPAPSAHPAGNTFAPYVMVEVDHDNNSATPDTRVAVLGYSTDDSTILTEETVDVLDVIEVRWSDDDASTIDLKDWVAFLRKPLSEGGEAADSVVLLSHVGHRRLNATSQILLGDNGDVAPPDVVISGHWHTWTDTAWQPSNLNYNTTNVEAASYGQYVGELQITPQGRYVGSTKYPIKSDDIAANAGMLTLLSNLTAEYNALTDHPCILPTSVTGNSSALEPCPLHHVVGHSATDLSLDKDKWFTLSEFPWSGSNTAGEWISDAMVWKVRDAGGTAHLAFQSGGGVRRDVAAGEVTYLEVYETYPWNDDQMVKVSMSSNDVWRYIESHFVGSSLSEGWQVTADDGVVTAISYDADGAGPGAPVALLESDTTTMWDVIISEYMYQHDDWINETGADFTFQDLAGTATELGYSIRDSVVEYTAQFDANNPMTVDGPRYILNTELAGGFTAVVTMLNDAENEPYFEAVFVRLLSATPETVARRHEYGLSDLVNADGSINPHHQFAETMLYRSHLGFPDGYLNVGDMLEIWGEGGFFDGNPQFVDQQGIQSAEQEFIMLGNDPSKAMPEFKQFITDFFNEANENHLVKFQATRVSDNQVRDSNGDVITIYKEGGFFDVDSLPGANGDVLEMVGVQTHRESRDPARRFRLREASVVTGFAPASMVDDNLPADIKAGETISLSAAASDINGTHVTTCQVNGNRLAYTSFEEPSTGGRYEDPNTATHALANFSGLADVVYTSTGSELGFSALFTSTGGSGLSDGDFVGVQNFTGDVGSYTEGTQGYEMSDTDGIMTVSLDSVDLSAQSHASVCIDLFVSETGWESSDNLRIWVSNGGTEFDLLNTVGQDIDAITLAGAALEGAWHTLSLDLSGFASATLHMQLESNSAAEEVYFDNIVFTDAAPAQGGATQNIGSIAQVEFFYSNDGGQSYVSAGVDSNGADGWSLDFVPPEAGDYRFYSQATDSDGVVEPSPVLADVKAAVAGAETVQVPLPLWPQLLLLSVFIWGVACHKNKV